MPRTRSRQTDCLPQERAELDPDKDTIDFGSLRFDRYWSDGSYSTLEGGLAQVAGPVFQTGIGRVQLVDVDRQWARPNHSMENWNFMAAYNGRKADEQTALSTGVNLALDDKNWKGEMQGWWSFAGDRLRLVGGLSYEDERVDSVDKAGPVRPRLLPGQPFTQERLGHWMQRAASREASASLYPRATSRKFLARVSGSCLGISTRFKLSSAMM